MIQDGYDKVSWSSYSMGLLYQYHRVAVLRGRVQDSLDLEMGNCNHWTRDDRRSSNGQ